MQDYKSRRFLKVVMADTDVTPSGNRFQYFTTLHGNLLRFLRVLPSCCVNYRGDPLAFTWLSGLFCDTLPCVKTRSLKSHPCWMGGDFRALDLFTYESPLRTFTLPCYWSLSSIRMVDSWFEGRISRCSLTSKVYKGTEIAIVRQVNDAFMQCAKHFIQMRPNPNRLF